MNLRLPLGIQLTLPGAFEADSGFSALLRALREEAFTELELAIADAGSVGSRSLRRFLSNRGFALTRLATGAAARRSSSAS